jgi:hypothetical protein
MSTSSNEPGTSDAELDGDPSPGTRATGDTSHASNNEATPKNHANELPMQQPSARCAAEFRADSLPDFEPLAEPFDQHPFDFQRSFALESGLCGFLGLGYRHLADHFADFGDRGGLHAELTQAHTD